MRVLVTGGAGFIGSHTVRTLVERGHAVAVLDDLSTGDRARLRDLDGKVRLVEGDLLDPAARAAALDGASHVLHLAALPSVARSIAEPLRSHAVNATGTAELLEDCRRRGVERVVVASSSSVYGNEPGTGPRDEGMRPRPESPYAASKLATESYALAWGKSYGLGTVALRYFNVFGPGQDPRGDYAALIPRFIAAGIAGQPVTVHGDGEQTRDFTYVANAVEANLLALVAPGAPGEALNVACGVSTSVQGVVEAIGKALGRPLEVVHGPARAGDVRHSLADLGRVRSCLGYRPAVDFAEGLRRTVEALASGGGAA